jgi:predicted CDP-diglyceride synthetase/phosphatidate cytidylyltransferase
VDGAQQETVITFFVVILKPNVVILTLVGTITFLSYVNLLTIRNNERTAKYEKIIVDSLFVQNQERVSLRTLAM